MLKSQLNIEDFQGVFLPTKPTSFGFRDADYNVKRFRKKISGVHTWTINLSKAFIKTSLFDHFSVNGHI